MSQLLDDEERRRARWPFPPNEFIRASELYNFGRNAVTSWSDLRRYQCHVCRVNCINREDDPWTKATECRDCYRVPDLSQAPSPTPSEGSGAEGTSVAGLPRPEAAPERPEGAAEATTAERGLAPDRGARASPRAQLGEGNEWRSSTLDEFGVSPGER